MANLIEDVSSLTKVSEKTLEKFIPTCSLCIGHALHESLCCKQEFAEIDIGIGYLQLKVDIDGLHYKFLPSKELEKTLVQTVTTKTSPIAITLDKNLQEKIDRAYKELL